MKKEKAITPGPTKATKVTEEAELWISILKTQVEDAGGEHYLADLQQNQTTKDIRVVRVK
jgi:hypothetical protein